MGYTTLRDVADKVARRQPFKGNSITAEVNPRWVNEGRLPAEWCAVLRSDESEVGIAYVVFSYATPIAWVRRDGIHVMPPVRYSVTTSKQQNYVSQGLAQTGA